MAATELRRLARLQRLERIRAIAKQAALAEAAEAEGTLAQLHALSERTALLADAYGGAGGAANGWALRQWGSFAQGLHQVHAATVRDAERARDIADAKHQALGAAERSRMAAEDRAEAERRNLARKRAAPQIGARRPTGTGLE